MVIADFKIFNVYAFVQETLKGTSITNRESCRSETDEALGRHSATSQVSHEFC